MANTFELISAVTVGSGGASSIDFTSIPSTYTDLCLKISARTSESTVYGTIYVKINGSQTGLMRFVQGNGSGATSGSNAVNMADIITGNGATSSTFSNYELYLPNYASSNYKSYSAESANETNATTAYSRFTAGLYQSTSAVTSLGIIPESGTETLVQFSTAYLYGVKNT